MAMLLSVEDYSLDYETPTGTLRALDRVSLSVDHGEVLGLVGESGSGKTTLAMAIMRLLVSNAHERAGAIVFDGQDLTGVSQGAMLAVRGRRIGMIFQDPSTALNPTLTLGLQVAEVIARHRRLPPREAWAEAIGWLRHVELREPEAIMRRYPHEVSGGEKQRVVIAAAFAPHPELILFDEPTTALDVITGARILELFRRLRRETRVGGLYILHDLALVSRVADRVAVIERGRIVEQARASRIFSAPAHAYTSRLVAAARAFAARPRIVICDEITSSLDVSVQAAVIDLLLELRRRYGTSYLFITHDLNLVRQIAHRLAVMRQGELVDLLPVDDLGSGREHDYTRALMQASPTPVG
jgi:peptide/nickel transport system ATP-binding protein